MPAQKTIPVFRFMFLMVLFSLACSTTILQSSPTPAPTDTSLPTATDSPTPTITPKPSSTPRPTRTPNLAATEKYEEFNAEAQKYYDLGYLTTVNGRFVEYDDFEEEWAQLGWYRRWNLRESARNFFISARFKWSSAYRSADISGCGFAFATQPNEDHYAVFLDRSRVYFVVTDYYFQPFGPTRGNGRVDFGNPFDAPLEADFTLIVKGTNAYVLVDNGLVGEYTLSESRAVRGRIGLTLLSGTNKDFGTRCEMTNLHLWIPRGE